MLSLNPDKTTYRSYSPLIDPFSPTVAEASSDDYVFVEEKEFEEPGHYFDVLCKMAACLGEIKQLFEVQVKGLGGDGLNAFHLIDSLISTYHDMRKTLPEIDRGKLSEPDQGKYLLLEKQKIEKYCKEFILSRYSERTEHFTGKQRVHLIKRMAALGIMFNYYSDLISQVNDFFIKFQEECRTHFDSPNHQRIIAQKMYRLIYFYDTSLEIVEAYIQSPREVPYELALVKGLFNKTFNRHTHAIFREMTPYLSKESQRAVMLKMSSKNIVDPGPELRY